MKEIPKVLPNGSCNSNGHGPTCTSACETPNAGQKDTILLSAGEVMEEAYLFTEFTLFHTTCIKFSDEDVDIEIYCFVQ